MEQGLPGPLPAAPPALISETRAQPLSIPRVQQRGSRVEEYSQGLLDAVIRNDYSALVYYLSMGGLAGYQDPETGKTALHYEVESRESVEDKLDVIKILVQNGAIVDEKDLSGKTALDLAEGQPEVQELLKELRAGAGAGAGEPKEELSESKF